MKTAIPMRCRALHSETARDGNPDSTQPYDEIDSSNAIYSVRHTLPVQALLPFAAVCTCWHVKTALVARETYKRTMDQQRTACLPPTTHYICSYMIVHVFTQPCVRKYESLLNSCCVVGWILICGAA